MQTHTIPIYSSRLSKLFTLFLAILGNENLLKFSKGLCNAYAFLNFYAAAIEQEEKHQARLMKWMQHDEKSITYLADSYKEYKNAQRVLPHKQLDSERLRQIKEAETLYSYIHSLTNLFDPGKNFNLRNGRKFINQGDFVEILQFFSQKKIAIKKVFEVAFSFTKEELIQLFKNKYHKNTLCRGDMIRLASSDHAIFLSYINGQFRLYNPGLVKLKDNSVEALVSAIEQCLYAQNKQSIYMPIGMTIFAKKQRKYPMTRPSRMKLIKDILQARKVKNVDAPAGDGTTAAWIAANYGHIDTLNLLIEHKANLNSARETGSTPAWIAAQNDRFYFLQALARAKADLTLPTKEGFAPAYMAAQLGHHEGIKVLHDAKVDFNQAAPKTGDTPVMLAASYGYTSLIKQLCQYKADLNKSNFEGMTPLHWAVQKSQFATIKMLLQCGVKTNIRDRNGKLAIDYANANMKSFVFLHMLKKYIESHAWKGKCPLLAAKQLEIINAADKKVDTDWVTILKMIYQMIEDNPLQRFSIFKPSAKIQDVYENLADAIVETKPRSSP